MLEDLPSGRLRLKLCCIATLAGQFQCEDFHVSFKSTLEFSQAV